MLIEDIPSKTEQQYNIAFSLSVFTIVFTFFEGIFSAYFGVRDETFTLLGFGVGSFVEVISGIGIAHMIIRIRVDKNSNRDNFEKIALKVTGLSFYILTFGLLVTGTYNIIANRKPDSTIWGLIISVISIIAMWILARKKMYVGKKLNSKAVIADAGCTKVCIYSSVIVLISSGLYEIFKLPYIDSIGTFGLAYFAFSEGKECFHMAKSDALCGCV